jgi:CRISP-associated protein Cas1
MIRKTIELATAGTRLSVANHQLVIARPDMDEARVPIEDIGVLVVDSIQTSYTHSVLLELAQAGAALLISGHNHLPAGIFLPMQGHSSLTERHHIQISASEPLKKQAWKNLITAKLRQQSNALLAFGGDDRGLLEMSRRVKSGDPENLEAQGAQRYWPALLGNDFRRGEHDTDINGLLNYGYAVLRAVLARSIVASGLIPSIGVHHRNRSNPFCLADDLIEPYRPYVDWQVRRLVDAGETVEPDNREARKAMLGLLNETVSITGRNSPLQLAMQNTAASMARLYAGEEKTLALPEGMPMSMGPDD